MFFKRFKVKRLTKKAKSMQQSRIHSQADEVTLKKEINIYYTLAEIYNKKQGKKKWPFAREMALECYRAAAGIDDSEAQYILGKNLLDEANFRRSLQQSEVFASPTNETRMNNLYSEALAYLKAAENLDHIKAKRLHGLCYINGWGLEQDKKHGFDLVVESIEMQNSWDKVPQIFADMDLNKPEFFSQLSKARNKL
jgi:TPR repeat protein